LDQFNYIVVDDVSSSPIWFIEDKNKQKTFWNPILSLEFIGQNFVLTLRLMLSN